MFKRDCAAGDGEAAVWTSMEMPLMPRHSIRCQNPNHLNTKTLVWRHQRIINLESVHSWIAVARASTSGRSRAENGLDRGVICESFVAVSYAVILRTIIPLASPSRPRHPFLRSLSGAQHAASRVPGAAAEGVQHQAHAGGESGLSPSHHSTLSVIPGARG